MHCPKCNQVVPEDAKTCPYCASGQLLRCGQCNAVLTANAKFCSQCGAAIGINSVTGQRSESDSEQQLTSERRQLTVMFCDLVGSTALSERLDPEELSQLLVGFRGTCMQAVKTWEGYVANYLGDGVLVYFGYPQAHEDDPQRAIYAAQDIVSCVQEFDTEELGFDSDLTVRIGIATGLVVIGDIGSGEVTERLGVVGETPNIAAKLQAQAAKNSIVINQATKNRIEGLFAVHYLGELRIKGMTNKVTTYEVLPGKIDADRFQVKRDRGLTRLSGRQDEIKQLVRRWRHAQVGLLKTIMISGEAGIGKSRLVWSFRKWLKGVPHQRISFYCSPYHQRSALFPVIDFINRELNKQKTDDNARKLDIVLRRLKVFSENEVAQHRRLILSLIDKDATDDIPDDYQHRIFNTLIELFQAYSKNNPLLIVVEDLHWIDPTSRALLEQLLRGDTLTHTLLIGTSREVEDLGGSDGLALELQPLSEHDSMRLVKNAASGQKLPESLLKHLVTASDGNPLYLEELTKNIIETGMFSNASDDVVNASNLTNLKVPESLQDLLMSRLDRFSTEKKISQLAAAIGRQFDMRLLQGIAEMEPAVLDTALQKLVDAGILYVRKGAQQEVLFEFKHALLRDAAYNTLLKSERHPVHLKIAQLLIKDDPNIIDSQPELLAYHLTEGKDSQGAIRAWKYAGRKAVRLSAHVEAIAHFRQALALLDQLPENPLYDRIRLQLLIELGPPLIAVESWSAQSVEDLYTESYSLSTKLSDDQQLFSSLRGVWGNASFRGDLDQARRCTRQLLELASRSGNISLMIEAELSSAFNQYWAGDFETSLRMVSHVNKQYDPGQHGDNAFVFAVDPCVSALFYAARNLWHLGYPDRALKKIKQSIGLAEKLKHYPSLTWGLGFYASIHYYRREYKQAKKQAKRAIKLCKERNFPIWLAWGQVLNG